MLHGEVSKFGHPTRIKNVACFLKWKGYFLKGVFWEYRISNYVTSDKGYHITIENMELIPQKSDIFILHHIIISGTKIGYYYITTKGYFTFSFRLFCNLPRELPRATPTYFLYFYWKKFRFLVLN